jgi:hypothetical protein
MGRLKQGILGGVSGKVGAVVGTSWKGIAVIKAMPLSVANPRTAGQIAQRGKMANCVAFSRALLGSVIKPLNDRFAVKQSGYNAFVSRNIDLFADFYPSPPANLRLAVGKMVAVDPSSVVADESSNSVVVNWPTTLPDAFAQASDKAYIVVYSDETGVAGISAASVIRSAGTATIAGFDGVVEGGTIRAWLCFLRADGTVVSNTGYKATVVVA